MPSFTFDIGEKEAAVARFFNHVHAAIQKAVLTEKRRHKRTQQWIASKLGVHRSVVNRQVMGYENLTMKSIAELAWAIGYEPRLSLRPIEQKGANYSLPIPESSGAQGTTGIIPFKQAA